MRLNFFICAAVMAWGGAAWAQTPSSTIISGGYSFPTALKVAPGQVLTFIAQGVGRNLIGPVLAPAGVDLPLSLAGISATLQQGANRDVPILSVRPISTCVTMSVNTPCSGGTLTAITVQIPFNILAYCGEQCGMGLPHQLAPTLLWFSENGSPSTMFELIPFATRVHILTGCDTIFPDPTKLPIGIIDTGLPCPPLVTHADGSLVSGQNPARPGEEVVAYATGLGQTNPAASTGKIVSGTASTSRGFVLDFNFHLNAGPSKPVYGPAPAPSADRVPAYTGLTPGFVGLYQINFKVPQPPGDLRPCVPATPGEVFQSNLTVSVGGNEYSDAYDGAGICVTTGGATP